MPLVQEQRRLAAIVSIEVVGYSRLMGRNESGTHALPASPVPQDGGSGDGRLSVRQTAPVARTNQHHFCCRPFERVSHR